MPVVLEPIPSSCSTTIVGEGLMVGGGASVFVGSGESVGMGSGVSVGVGSGVSVGVDVSVGLGMITIVLVAVGGGGGSGGIEDAVGVGIVCADAPSQLPPEHNTTRTLKQLTRTNLAHVLKDR